jgi:hypothetical protein
MSSTAQKVQSQAEKGLKSAQKQVNSLGGTSWDLTATTGLIAGGVAIVAVIENVLSEGWYFFLWHPLLMAIAFGILMPQAFIAMQNGKSWIPGIDKFLGGQKTNHHYWLIVAAEVLSFSALYVIYRNKDLKGKPHFKSNHGLLGITVLSAIPFGSMVGRKIWITGDVMTAFIPDSLKPRLRPLHKLAGSVLMLTGAVTFLLGAYTNWASKRPRIVELALTISSWAFVGSIVYRMITKLLK